MSRILPQTTVRSVLIVLALACLPVQAGAAPPKLDSRFAELPSPEELAAQPSPETDGDAPQAATPEPAPEPALEWVKHRIVPGELIGDIALRYGVSKDKLIRWNKLDAKKPKIFAGRHLKIRTKHAPPPRYTISYTVERGDTWSKIAKAHHVDADLLRTRWNPKVPRRFKAGQKIVIWLDPLDDPSYVRERSSKSKPGKDPALAHGEVPLDGTTTGGGPAPTPLPLVSIPRGSVSVGKPSGGKVQHSAQLPINKQLYTLRKPDEAYGSTHTLDNLQLAIARWRRGTGFRGALKIGSISKQGGGKLKPHSSHRSGRDVDIRLPVKQKGGAADDVNEVDWDALWGLVIALVDTGEVETIYLTTDRQKHLHAAARRAGASKATIDRVLQYPESRGRNNGIVRDQRGHTAHIHVRFSCAATETRCENN